jgi:hypothetical protein
MAIAEDLSEREMVPTVEQLFRHRLSELRQPLLAGTADEAFGEALRWDFFRRRRRWFCVDLLLLNHAPWMLGLFWPVFCGTLAASVSASRLKSFRFTLSLWVVLVTLGVLAYCTALSSMSLDLQPRIHWRVVFDVVGIWLGTALAFRLFLSFITSQGQESVRMQTELSLAHGIRATLVPTISFQNDSFEGFGNRFPAQKWVET